MIAFAQYKQRLDDAYLGRRTRKFTGYFVFFLWGVWTFYFTDIFPLSVELSSKANVEINFVELNCLHERLLITC
jgi:hypothetical protein